MPVSLDSWEEKEKGNAAFKNGNWQLSIQHYSAAIANDIDPGDPLYFTNRAQAYLKVEKWDLAEKDCTSALAIDSRISKAYWRRATARKNSNNRKTLEGSIQDYGQWLTYATIEGKADTSSKELMKIAISETEVKIRNIVAPPSAAPTPRAPPTPAAGVAPSTPSASSSSRASRATPQGRVEPTVKNQLDKVTKAFDELSQLWADKSDLIITTWKDIALPDLREAKLRTAFDPVKPKKEYPEFKPSALAEGSNLLDFLWARANRSPANFAFHLDLGRAQLARAQADSSSSASSRNSGPNRNRAANTSTNRNAPAPGRSAAYMLLFDSSYGQVVDVDVSNSEALEARKKILEKGDACELEDGVAMLERQIQSYGAALRMAKLLVELGDDGEVNQSSVDEYEGCVKNRDYTGRDEYSIQRVEQIVLSSKAYAEDHLEFLQTDPEYVAEHITDRIPSAVPSSAHDMIQLLGKEEAMEMFLNAYARQTLWKEVINVIALLKTMSPELGPGKTLPQLYQRKIGLLAKLVEAFINLTWKELSAAAEKCFEVEFKAMAMEDEGNDSFHAFLDMMAEIQGLAVPSAQRAPRPRARRDPLASMFKSLIRLDPQQMQKQTWEIVACLNELKGLFDRQPEQKRRLSRRLVEGLGEYTEAIELREMLLDSHRPRFSRDWSDRSNFLLQLGPLWQQLERCWTKAVQPKMIGAIIREKTPAALTIVWTKFNTEVKRHLKAEPEELFEKLLSKTHDIAKKPTATSAAAVEEDEDSDAPPALIQGSDEDDEDWDDEESSEYDSDAPPALYAPSSDEDDPDMPALESEESDSEDEAPQPTRPSTTTRRPPPRRTRPPRPPRAAPAPEPQPGPSHSSRAQRTPAAAADTSGLRPDHEFGTRDGVRPPSPSEEERHRRQHGQRREKKKTRKQKDDALLAAQAAGMNVEDFSTSGADTTDGDTTDSEGGLPEDTKFYVTERVYATFEQYLGGGPTTSRTDVAWIDFKYAMDFIGFQSVRGAGSSWKFYPERKFREMGLTTIVIHEPHPASTQRPHQVSWTGKRLKKTYDMRMEMFEIDNTRFRSTL